MRPGAGAVRSRMLLIPSAYGSSFLAQHLAQHLRFPGSYHTSYTYSEQIYFLGLMESNTTSSQRF